MKIELDKNILKSLQRWSIEALPIVKIVRSRSSSSEVSFMKFENQMLFPLGFPDLHVHWFICSRVKPNPITTCGVSPEWKLPPTFPNKRIIDDPFGYFHRIEKACYNGFPFCFITSSTAFALAKIRGLVPGHCSAVNKGAVSPPLLSIGISFKVPIVCENSRSGG